VDVRTAEAVMSELSPAGDSSDEAGEPISDEPALDARSVRDAIPGHDDA